MELGEVDPQYPNQVCRKHRRKGVSHLRERVIHGNGENGEVPWTRPPTHYRPQGNPAQQQETGLRRVAANEPKTPIETARSARSKAFPKMCARLRRSWMLSISRQANNGTRNKA